MALAGVPYKFVKNRFGISKSHYYGQRDRAEKILKILFAGGEWPRNIIVVTRNFIERCVMALSLHCRAPIESIVAFSDLVIGHHISKGTIHRIREKAAKSAGKFDADVSLNSIKEIASDEIFQQNKPVLTTVDLASGYVVGMDAAPDRSSESWEHMLEKEKVQGLDPELNASDGAAGLLNGMKRAFPDIEQQPDVFHLLRDLGREVSHIERLAETKLQRHHDLKYWTCAKNREKSKRFSWSEYDNLCETIDSTLQATDEVMILFGWLREYTAFSGYGYAKSFELCNWILDEMAMRFPSREKYQKSVRAFRKSLPRLLSFLHRLCRKMATEAPMFHVSAHDFMLLYNQRACPYTSPEYEFMDQRLFTRFGKLLPDASEALDRMIASSHRASSMIENLNGRIRSFVDLKREIPEQFLILIKVFFNTKKPFRSRHSGWKNTSALERLTGKQYPEFLDLVVAPNDYMIL